MILAQILFWTGLVFKKDLVDFNYLGVKERAFVKRRKFGAEVFSIEFLLFRKETTLKLKTKKEITLTI